MAVITISRLLGSDGDEIALKVAEGIGYDLVDSELITKVAERAGVSVDEVRNVDETYHSRASEWLKSFITPSTRKILLEKDGQLNPKSYVEYCKTILCGLAEKGKMVIVGRGSQFILKDYDNVFHVRIVADEIFRTERIKISRGISIEDARDVVRKSDRARKQYIERYLKADWNDVSAYHLIIDSSRLGIDVTSSIIIDAARQFSRAHEFVPGEKDRRGDGRRIENRRKSSRRDPMLKWTTRDMENAILHDGRSIRSLNRTDRRQKSRRNKSRRDEK